MNRFQSGCKHERVERGGKGKLEETKRWVREQAKRGPSCHQKPEASEYDAPPDTFHIEPSAPAASRAATHV